MCGICGFVTRKAVSLDILKGMNDTLKHRGPDDHGEEIYDIKNLGNVGFGHRRLSIIDLSERGHQPMHSCDGRVSVVFNGEIYNYNELKEELKDYPFRSDADTEVIIAAYLKWGINFVDRINGMYGIAIVDRDYGVVYLIRDRIGKKPLYYYQNSDNECVFGSEIKAILASEMVKRELNTDILGQYFNKLYINAPYTIYKNIYKLEPGGIIEISSKGISNSKYWDVAERYSCLKQSQITDYDEAKMQLKSLLENSIRSRLIADVPIGAFLSGGYDSSLVCAIAQGLSPNPLKTFCIGFENLKFNEAEYAKEVAQYLGTDHTELYITDKDMWQLIESIPQYYDEPFADSSQIPTMLVSALARKEVSVVLSGDGGDELFGGYNIYRTLYRAQKRKKYGRFIYYLKKIPGIENRLDWSATPLENRIASETVNKNIKTQAGVNSYLKIINQMLLSREQNYFFEMENKYNEKSYAMTRMLLDMDTYLPGDILTKVDRASMKYALECRCPILDKNIIEFSFRLPSRFKDNNGELKKILKDVTHEYIPSNIMERPKQGFGVPLNSWLTGPLREQLLDWSSKDFLEKQGIFNPEFTETFIRQYLASGDGGKGSGKNYSGICWAYFIFQQWYGKYMEQI